ncbi:amidase [Pelagirhabdus alkalitolerans]|uniref:Amidase n=1 Tax=Pelagirhabdus alkalitolerans TaxID=1612202 RepID=A0A1G6GQI4_9BACI|nr:amidase family protein [Pelagirhabdus alkalitolerans]SDB84208.1 amidase [Pelagirhabdus alkalitolerans]
MTFNSDAYLKNQKMKQFKKPPTSSYKVRLKAERQEVDSELMDRILSSDSEGLQALVKTNQATYADIAKAFYNRVLDTRGTQAVITLNESIIEEAAACVYNEKHDPLYGLPVLIKDNIQTVNMPTTAGAAILKDFYSKEDAEIIQALKEKGALILGKTNLSEWANFMTTDSANGYSAIGGQTKNPFGPFDVGGSSSGSAVAVAEHMSPVAIGTETAGSIIYPASQNGVVGLKPTLTTVSQDGIIPIAKAHDTAGPMANTVKDCYYLFKAMAPIEGRLDDFSKPLDAYTFGELTDQAITGTYREEDASVIRTFTDGLKEAGASCEHVTLNEEAHNVNFFDVLIYQFGEGVREFFKRTDQPITLEDVFKFNEQDPKDRVPYGQDLIEKSIRHDFSEETIQQLIEKNRSITKDALDEAFQSVDFLITLSNYATSLYATSGYPALTLPGFKRETGEPIGVTIIGKAYQDVELLHVGQLIEQLGVGW